MGFFDFDGDAYINYEDRRDNSRAKHIKGIKCDVNNCVYHDGSNYCTADQIAVGPSYAKSCTETVCATFKQRTL